MNGASFKFAGGKTPRSSGRLAILLGCTLVVCTLALGCQKVTTGAKHPTEKRSAVAGRTPHDHEKKLADQGRRPPQDRASKEANLAAARELDHQGVRLFTDGRYQQALFFFEEAHKRGGPPSELWNMVRCLQKMDDAEGAANTLERYLEQPRLSTEERDEGRRELAELRKRPSRVTVISTPSGATVYVDDRRNMPLGRTPVSFDVAPGGHTISAELPGHSADSARLKALLGQAVVVDLQLPPE